MSPYRHGDAISPSVPRKSGEVKGSCSFLEGAQAFSHHSQNIVIRDDNFIPGRIFQRGHHDGGLVILLLESLHDGLEDTVGFEAGVGRRHRHRLFGLDCRRHLVHRRRGWEIAAVHDCPVRCRVVQAGGRRCPYYLSTNRSRTTISDSCLFESRFAIVVFLHSSVGLASSRPLLERSSCCVPCYNLSTCISPLFGHRSLLLHVACFSWL